MTERVLFGPGGATEEKQDIEIDWLEQLYQAVDGLEFGVDNLVLNAENINLNTDALEALEEQIYDELALLVATQPGSHVDVGNTTVFNTPLTASEVRRGTAKYVEHAGCIIFLYAIQPVSQAPALVQLEYSDTEDFAVITGTSTLALKQVVSGPFTYAVYLSIVNGSFSGKWYRGKLTNGAVDQTSTPIAFAAVNKFPFSGTFGALDAPLTFFSQALLTRSVLAVVDEDGLIGNVVGDRDHHIQISASQYTDTDNSVIITEASLEGATPGDPWSGTEFATRSRNIQENLTTIVAVDSLGNLLESLGGTLTFVYSDDVGGVPVPQVVENLPIRSFSTIRGTGWLSNSGDYYHVIFEPNRPLIAGETVIINTTHSKLTGNDFKRLTTQVLEQENQLVSTTQAFLKGFDGKGNSKNFRATGDSALLVHQARQLITPGGSSYSEGLLDYIRHDFGEVNGAHQVASLVDLGSGGTATHDPGNGVLFSSAGGICHFRSEHALQYGDNPGHGIVGEQTFFLDPLSDPVTGDAKIRFGYGTPTNGFGFEYTVLGWATWLTKDGVDIFHDLQSEGWNLDAADGSEFSNFVRLTNGARVPEALDIYKDNLFHFEGEFLYAAGQIFGLKTPLDEILSVNIHQYPNSQTMTSLRSAVLHEFVYIDPGTTGADIRLRSGSWHGGVFSSKALQIARDPSGKLVDVVASGVDSTNSRSGPMASNENFTGPAKSASGYSGLMVLVNSEQVSASDGFVVEFSETEDFSFIHRDQSLTYDSSAVNSGLPFFIPASQGEYYRVNYTNGGTASAEVLIRTYLLQSVAQQPLAGVAAPGVTDRSLSAMVRAFPAAKNPSGVYGNIDRGPLGGLNFNMFEATTDMPIRPGDDWDVTAVTATTTPTLLYTAPAGAVSVDINNADNNISVRVAKDLARLNAGQYRTILPGNSITLEIKEAKEIYGRSVSGTVRVEFTHVSDSTV